MTGHAAQICSRAPTHDPVLTAMPAEWWKATRSDSEAARRLLLFHAAQGRRLSRDIADNQVTAISDIWSLNCFCKITLCMNQFSR